MIKLNGKVLAFTKFPNGETNVSHDDIVKYQGLFNSIELKYESDDDFIKLMFLKKYLDASSADTTLNIAYMPYSRQDRVEGGSVFTLKYIADFINSLGFNTVNIVEPHSDVTMALVNNSYASYPTVDLIDQVKDDIEFNKKTDFVFYPDAGAAKRYSNKIGAANVLVGYKERDFATGKIKNLQVVGDMSLVGDFKVIIVDDLCSYGGTFILAAKQLKALGAKEVYLLVAHCENSIFDGKILSTNLIDGVYTTDSIVSYEDSKIHVFRGGIL